MLFFLGKLSCPAWLEHLTCKVVAKAAMQEGWD